MLHINLVLCSLLRTFAPAFMNQLTRLFVWLSRLHRCRGFGIQSPTDYWLVRYVLNEHWPYYQYAALGNGDNRLRRKLGLLYFRLANWRQPQTIVGSGYTDYWKAGCRKATVTQDIPPVVELMFTDIGKADQLTAVLEGHTDERSVIVVEALWRNRSAWHRLASHERVSVAFDLYYCGILTFDPKKTKKHYVINF